jgi:CRISPR/Cas system CSM-associated protein Csm4 (group 5 of RAMP superfamily)
MKNIIIKVEFYSPIVFQQHTTIDWKIPSDMIFRALTCSIYKLYDATHIKKFFELVNKEFFAISSLLLIHDKEIYLPHSGYLAYSTLDESKIIDTKDIKSMINYVRISRDGIMEPTPFTYPLLYLNKYKWGIIICGHEYIINSLIPALKLTGEIGIGARKSRGYGKFRISKVCEIEEYGISVTKNGILASRYLPKDKEIFSQVGVINEKFTLFYGVKKYEFNVIAEGSKLEKIDEGTIEYVENDLEYKVPVLLKPLTLSKRC